MNPSETSHVIELAWCDKTSFEAIYIETGLSEDSVKQLMRENLKPSSYRLWRKRVKGKAQKHPIYHKENHTNDNS